MDPDRDEDLAVKKIVWVSNFRPTVLWGDPHDNGQNLLKKCMEENVEHFIDPADHITRKELSDRHHYSAAGIRLMADVFLDKINKICS